MCGTLTEMKYLFWELKKKKDVKKRKVLFYMKYKMEKRERERERARDKEMQEKK